MRLLLRLDCGERLPMLYYVGSSFLIVWFVLKFVMHKGGVIHTLLLTGIGFIVVQFVQHLRTREYERSLRR